MAYRFSTSGSIVPVALVLASILVLLPSQVVDGHQAEDGDRPQELSSSDEELSKSVNGSVEGQDNQEMLTTSASSFSSPPLNSSDIWPAPDPNSYKVIWTLFGVQVFLLFALAIGWILEAGRYVRCEAEKKAAAADAAKRYDKQQTKSDGAASYGTFTGHTTSNTTSSDSSSTHPTEPVVTIQQ